MDIPIIDVPIYAGVPITKESWQCPPEGYMLMSEAYDRHYRGVWSGFKSFAFALALRRKYKWSVGFGARQVYSAERLTGAACDGGLKVYVVADPSLQPNLDRSKWPAAPTREPVIVPYEVVNRLIKSRGILPDHAICPTLKTAGHDSTLYVLLKVGVLIVRECEFERWYRSERLKGKWPSQQFRVRKGIGRPTLQSESLKNEVLSLVRRQMWRASDGIATLHRILSERAQLDDMPSVDTLGRLITRLYLETADFAFRRVLRIPKKSH
jgi:hypothetical protein